MKVLTVRQPYAEAIVRGLKRFENRTWRTGYTGEVLLHASSQLDTDIKRRFFDMINGQAPFNLFKIAYGAVIGRARIVKCHDMRSCANYDICTGQEAFWGMTPYGSFAWELADAQKFPEPVYCKGRLGLWELPEESELANYCVLNKYQINT